MIINKTRAELLAVEKSIRNCRKNGKALAVISQSAIYKDGRIVGIQYHKPIIKELRRIENHEH